MIRGWLRERRARRLRDRARTLDPAALEDDLDTLEAAATDGTGQEQALAVEALSALARGGADPRTADDRHDEMADDAVPERAAVALVAALPIADDDLEADAVRTLRYVVSERPDTAALEHLDDPLAAAVDDWDHTAHRQVTLDAGVLLASGAELPATRAALWAALDGGPPAVREHAAVAYLQVVDRPGALDDPAAVAAALREVVQGREEPLPPEGSAPRTLADGRTVSEAVDAFEREM